MTDFIKEYGNNITFAIVILGFIVTIIVQWDTITKRITSMFETSERIPLLLFKLLVISFSGLIAASIYWILIDYNVFGNFSKIILPDIASGATWGIPIALVVSRAKNTEAALVWSVLTGFFISLVITPSQVLLAVKMTKVNYLVLLWLVSSLSLFTGYISYKVNRFLETVSPNMKG